MGFGNWQNLRLNRVELNSKKRKSFQGNFTRIVRWCAAAQDNFEDTKLHMRNSLAPSSGQIQTQEKRKRERK